jgi:hypothetical protein
LTDEHLTPAQCAPLKRSYDELGERVLARLNEISPPPSKDLPRKQSQFSKAVPGELHTESDPGEKPKVPQRDLYALLKEHAEHDDLLQQFWKEVNTVPDWVDWAQIERGQDVFYRYGGACLTGLAFQSLLGGMGAARVVETLARTGGFSTKVARGRLFETTQHILQCTKDLASMQPGGDGFASTIRVRLLHAAVRQRILGMEKARPGYYNVEAWGTPINDLDCLATIASFSGSLIWLSLPRQGIFLRRQETDDYVALWRYIAYVIGCKDIGFRTAAEAKRICETLLYYEIDPSATSRIMANNIIKSLDGQPPAYTSAAFLAANARWLNGNELCDRLGIERPGWYYYVLTTGQCLFFCFFCYLYRSFPSMDRKKIATLKHAFYRLIVHSSFGLQGQESNFEFKYMPEYHILTEMGEAQPTTGSGANLEERYLRTFLIATALVGGIAVVGTVSALRVLGFGA